MYANLELLLIDWLKDRGLSQCILFVLVVRNVVKVVVVIPSFNHLSVEELEKELDVHYLTRSGPRATGRQRFHA